MGWRVRGLSHGLPAPTPTERLAGHFLAARQLPDSLRVTSGAQPDAVTHPGGPLAFLAFVSDDAGSAGRGELWREGASV